MLHQPQKTLYSRHTARLKSDFVAGLLVVWLSFSYLLQYIPNYLQRVHNYHSFVNMYASLTSIRLILCHYFRVEKTAECGGEFRALCWSKPP
jgi:hypothetical protein